MYLPYNICDMIMYMYTLSHYLSNKLDALIIAFLHKVIPTEYNTVNNKELSTIHISFYWLEFFL
jgi:hypothetical protein